MDLFLRKIDHPHAPDSYRVIQKDNDGTEVELGSISTQVSTRAETVWTWGIDCVVPTRTLETEGRGQDLKDCMKRFRIAWEKFCADEARLVEFMEAKRRAKRAWW
jgi:hypothetical protein